jgi:hypothetical protein
VSSIGSPPQIGFYNIMGDRVSNAGNMVVFRETADRCAQASKLLLIIISCFPSNLQVKPATGSTIGPAGQIIRRTVSPSSRL